jgi:hypothetical protein
MEEQSGHGPHPKRSNPNTTIGHLPKNRDMQRYHIIRKWMVLIK